MATVRMVKGNKFADIFDSPETIKQAQLEGYSMAEKKEPAAGKNVDESKKASDDGERPRAGRPSKQQ